MRVVRVRIYNIFLCLPAHFVKRHTIKPGTPECGTTERRTPVEHGILAEQQNTCEAVGMSRNSRTLAEQWYTGGKTEQQITPIRNDDISTR